MALSGLLPHRWQGLVPSLRSLGDFQAADPPTELDAALARVAAASASLGAGERAHELAKLDLDRLAQDLGRPLQVWEPQRYRLVLGAAGAIAGFAAARAVAPWMPGEPLLALLLGAALSAQLVSAVHPAGRRLRQLPHMLRRDGVGRASAAAALALGHALLVVALPAALGLVHGVAAPLALIAAAAALGVAAFVRHDPHPDLEAADRAMRAAETRLVAVRAEHDAAVAAARALFEARLATLASVRAA